MAARRPPAPARPRAASTSSDSRRRPTGSSGRTGQPARPPARSAARPAGATRADERRNHQHDDDSEPRTVRLARGLSVRAVVFGLVVLSAFALLFPSMRAYLAQRAELDRMIADVEAAERTEAELRAELERWDDPAFVQAQARDRLMFVMPGETAYRVIDPEVVVEAPALDSGALPEDGPTLPFGSAVMPWYATIWESVQISGSYDPDGAVPADADADADTDGQTAGEIRNGDGPGADDDAPTAPEDR